MTSFDEAFERELAVAVAAEAPRARPGFRDAAARARGRRVPAPSAALSCCLATPLGRGDVMPALAVATCAVVAVSVVGLEPR